VLHIYIYIYIYIYDISRLRVNLVNKTNLGHNLFLAYLYLSISTCFGRLCAHHQEKQLCLSMSYFNTVLNTTIYNYLKGVLNNVYSTLGTCYSVWMTVWYAGWTLHTRLSSTQNKKYQVSHKHSCFSWWWAHSRPKHVEIVKNTCANNKLCTKLALFTRLYRDARSTKHKIRI